MALDFSHWRRRVMARLALLLGVVLFTVNFGFSQSLDSEQSAFLGLINTYRAQNGVGPLQVSAALQTSSQWMSVDMATKNYFSHDDSLGRDPFTRMAVFGYSHTPAGENIAAGYSDAVSTFNQWLTACDADANGNCTYAHRENMRNGSFVVMGIGRAYGSSSNYGWYWTTDFGGYLDRTITPAPVAPTINSFAATPQTVTPGQRTMLSWNVSGATTITIDNGVGTVSSSSSVSVTPAATSTYHLTAGNSAGSATASVTVTVTGATSTGLGFYPITPCRAVDTRASQRKSGPFGPPSLMSYVTRDFPLFSSNCGVPNTARAYSLNFTVVPPGPLDFLTAWPSGQSFPSISTLNAPDGSTLANAGLVAAGTSGGVSAVAGLRTDLIVDINGYFAAPNGQELAFYTMVPCRVVDTRPSQGKTGGFGPPSLTPYISRDFPITSSSCNVPGAAKAYSLNMTVIPQGSLDFVSAWPAGKPYPNVSTLNSPRGAIIANAAIVPAGTNGLITAVAGNPTDLIVDINGYFAPPGSPGALQFYPVTPCRAADTRSSQGKGGPFGPPSLAAYTNRDFPITTSGCGIPASAQAFALNITAVPQGRLDFLSVWPAGKPYPGVSTLNSQNGTILANAAVVPAGTSGSITMVAGNPTDVIIDVNGYFAP